MQHTHTHTYTYTHPHAHEKEKEEEKKDYIRVISTLVRLTYLLKPQEANLGNCPVSMSKTKQYPGIFTPPFTPPPPPPHLL